LWTQEIPGNRLAPTSRFFVSLPRSPPPAKNGQYDSVRGIARFRLYQFFVRWRLLRRILPHSSRAEYFFFLSSRSFDS
jgi:hypothetical protein